MINKSRILRIFIAALAVAFVLPGTAAPPEKKFSVAMSPNTIGTSASLNATITNETPNGNSSINSLILTLPAGYTVDVSMTPSANWPGNVTWTSTSISVSNMSPLKPRDTFMLSFKVSVDSAAAGSCAPQLWNARAWTGSSFSGDTFRQLFPPEIAVNSTTTVVSGYALNFSPGPSNTTKNVAITPAVGVTLSSSCGPLNGPVTITVPGCTGACLTGNTATSSGGIATFPNLKIANPGAFHLVASSPGFTSITSASFTVFDGILKCEPGMPFTFSQFPPGVTNITQPGYAEGQRGKNNKDGSLCVPVAYSFINDILGSNTVMLKWDTASQPGAAFKYTVTWKPEYVDATTGMPSRTTYVAWFDSAGMPTPLVPGRACIGNQLPAPYGTLAVDIPNATDTLITVNPSVTLPPTPFPIVIDKERMTVTAVAGSAFTVVRGVGGTAAAAHLASPAPKYAMSTPLPLDGAIPPKQMQVCIVEEGWTTVPSGTPDCLPANPLQACVLFSTTVYDIGDGIVSRDF